jgi:peptidoglycan/xylan/chitin deacetylase (PgdA/CDA1 family)
MLWQIRRRGVIPSAIALGAATFTALSTTAAVVSPVPSAKVVAFVRSDVRHGLFAYQTPTPTANPHSPGPLSFKIAGGTHLNVPILVYHYIRVNPVASDKVGFKLSVTPDNFVAQMDYLKKVGAHTATIAELFSALSGGPPLPPRSVVLTFDDGHDDFATQAVPVLVSHGFVGTDYVVSGFMGRSSYMSADQVVSASNQGMVIGAHTVYHVSLPSRSTSDQIYEIQHSKQVLEQLIGKSVLDFAYPYGAFNSSVMAEVAAAGFRDARTTVWSENEYQSEVYSLPGVEITGWATLSTFAQLAQLPPP